MPYAEDYISNLAFPCILQDYLEADFKKHKKVETVSPINMKIIKEAVEWYTANPNMICQVSNTLFLDPQPDWTHFLKSILNKI
jgi:hypothetical protein